MTKVARNMAMFGAAATLMAAPALAGSESRAGRCVPPRSDVGGVMNAHTRYLESNLLPAVVQPGTKPATLEERMRAYNVPGVSIAVIHDGKLDWARGWGVRDTISCEAVTPETAFQSASISKAVTAIVALRLVEHGKIKLDENVNRSSLRSWQLPADPRLAPNGVTLRQLLNHTAGLGIHGFEGYLPGTPLPSPTEILNGAPPANSGAVRSVLPAGAQWRYSGGGYVVVQVALADATGMPFARLAQREILGPLGMNHSAYAQPPSAANLANAAFGHADGKVITGGYHVYPELGPAGLWTTAGDLARLLLDVQASAAGETGHRLSQAMTREMLTPGKGGWGLGPALYGEGDSRRFGHDGANEGFQSTMLAYVDKGEGVVVLTNGDQGKRLADEIVRAIATDYDWTELAAAPVVQAELSRDTVAKIAGLFEGGGLSVFLDARADGLFAQTGGPRPERLVALSPTRLRTDASGILIEFAPDYASFRIIDGGPPITLLRSTAAASAMGEVTIFVRGSMNDWSTIAPLTRQADGSYNTHIELAPGDYQFKLGSEDWRQSDFGTSAGETILTDGTSLQLVQHGGNIRLSIEHAGSYRLTFVPAANGKGDLSITALPRR
jgi:CubicO group peptidase (beta-lactamase class C family)